METRLIIDGGASAPAPPGKIAESPPPKEEFEKTLQTAKKEETPGEVAENEPNAQLQKLDSEKKETGSKILVAPVGLPIHIDPAILAQLQSVGIAQITSTASPTSNIKEDPGHQMKAVVQSFQATNTVKLDPLGPLMGKVTPQLDLKSIGTAVVQADKQKGVLHSDSKFAELSDKAVAQSLEALTLQLDATKNPTISALVTSAFDGTGEKKLGLGTANIDSATTLLDTPAKVTTAAKPNLIITDQAKVQLNVTSIKATSNEVVAQLSPAITSASLNEKVSVKTGLNPNSKIAIVADQKESSSGIGAILSTTDQMTQGGLTRDDNPEENASEKQKDDSKLQVPNMQGPASTNDAAPTTSTVSAHQMTTAERQAVVDTLTQKIEELAAKSVRNEVRVEMHPPDLGSVVVNIRKDMTGLTATLNASNEPLRQALHASRNDLAGALTDRNVGQVKIEVRGASADTMNLGQQFSQAQSHHQNQQDKKASHNAGNFDRETKETIEKPSQKRAITTLLDMEI